jgi:DeoR/GlpR family transcriptional regulator of sugar metabolism
VPERYGPAIRELSAKLELSEDTIRRDLRELAAEGLLTRVHGGALPASRTVVNLESRRSLSMDEKQRLGRLGASLVAKAKTAFIDGGTTNLELVRALPRTSKTHIFTHSPTIAEALEKHEAPVTIIGGRLFKHSMVATGAVTLSAISTLRVDLFVLGITGIHPDEGLTTGDEEESAIKRAIMKRSTETITLVTSDKLGAVSVHHVSNLAGLTALAITRNAKTPKFQKGAVKIMRAI